MKYAYIYKKENGFKTKDNACVEFFLENFSDYMHSSFYEYLDCTRWVEGYLNLEVIETEKYFIIMSEYSADEIAEECLERP